MLNRSAKFDKGIEKFRTSIIRVVKLIYAGVILNLTLPRGHLFEGDLLRKE